MRAVVAYDGREFFGFQRQARPVERSRTVQGELEAVLSRLLDVEDERSLHFAAAGRTDTGVHATGQVISFCCPTERLRGRGEADEAEALRRLTLGCNGLLPQDVRLLRLERAPVGPHLFSARFSALGKTYAYRVDAGPVAHPLRRRDHLHAHLDLDVERMRQAAHIFEGVHDFGGFANAATQPRDPVRLITRVEVFDEEAEAGNRLIRLEFTGSGFLFRQVRNMSGALLRVGSGRMSAGEVTQCLLTGKRPAAIKAVPAHGLCLTAVMYPDSPGVDPRLVEWAASREAIWRAGGGAPSEEDDEAE